MTQEDLEEFEKIELQDEELDSIAEHKFSSSTNGDCAAMLLINLTQY